MSRSGSENRKKTVHKSIRFDPEEWKEIEAQMDRAGLALGELVRHQCLGTALPFLRSQGVRGVTARGPTSRAILSGQSLSANPAAAT